MVKLTASTGRLLRDVLAYLTREDTNIPGIRRAELADRVKRFLADANVEPNEGEW